MIRIRCRLKDVCTLAMVRVWERLTEVIGSNS